MQKLVCIIFMLSIAIFIQGCSASSHSEPNMKESSTTASENERNDFEQVYKKYRLDKVGITPLLRHTWDNAGQIQPWYLYDFYRATGMWEYLQQHSNEQGDWVQIPQDEVEYYIERYFETDASAMRGALQELQLYDEREESYLFFVAQFSGEPPRLSNVDSDQFVLK